MGLNGRIDLCTNIKIRGQRGPGMPTKRSGQTSGPALCASAGDPTFGYKIYGTRRLRGTSVYSVSRRLPAGR